MKIGDRIMIASVPLDGSRDVCVLEADRLIPLQVIQAAIDFYTRSKIDRATLATQLAECLQCRVIIRGAGNTFALAEPTLMGAGK